jgi:hypothetical protein
LGHGFAEPSLAMICEDYSDLGNLGGHREIIAISCGFWVDMVLSFVAARSVLAGFERFNSEVQVLLHPRPPLDLKKKKKGRSCG